MNIKLLIQIMLLSIFLRQVYLHQNLEADIFKIYLKISSLLPLLRQLVAYHEVS